MSQISALLAADRYHRRARRVSKPHDGLTKDQLWNKLRHMEERAKAAAKRASRIAHSAHNYAQALTGDERRRMLELRDEAHACSAAASGETLDSIPMDRASGGAA